MKDETRLVQGDPSPDFELDNHKGNKIKLSEHRGKTVLLSFHPLAWTSICAKQMQSLEDNKEELDELNAVALGISVDTIPSKKAWAKELGIVHTSLLCDFWPHGKMIKDYRIFREEDGFSERTNIIVDPEGNIAFIKVYPIGELPDMDEIIEVIEKIER